MDAGLIEDALGSSLKRNAGKIVVIPPIAPGVDIPNPIG
jgi:hypothetical protein